MDEKQQAPLNAVNTLLFLLVPLKPEDVKALVRVDQKQEDHQIFGCLYEQMHHNYSTPLL
jgi:hypothetical protein